MPMITWVVSSEKYGEKISLKLHNLMQAMLSWLTETAMEANLSKFQYMAFSKTGHCSQNKDKQVCNFTGCSMC